MAMLELQRDLEKLTRSPKLVDAVQDVDRIIELLLEAREQVEADTHITGVTLSKLQNPIREELDKLSGDLKKVHKAQNDFNKSLKAYFSITKGSLPTEHDPMVNQEALINRAIAMHLLREGQFDVASTFISEAQPPHDEVDSEELGASSPLAAMAQAASRARPAHQSPAAEPRSRTGTPASYSSTPAGDAMITDADIPSSDLMGLQSQNLQSSFSEMYHILTHLKNYNLLPAIEWARGNAQELESRGSNLEFELCKLQFIWLFKGGSIHGGDSQVYDHDMRRDVALALQYARENFGRFQPRHLREIKQLSGAMVYASNMLTSPYKNMFAIWSAFDDIASSFTREFCSLLGLSAESPLYVAVTAGALALPQLVKYNAMMKAKGTEWTTQNELAFETPLPKSMVYHSIFVCPVSREQTTDANPPVMLSCGHVISRDSHQRLTKGSRCKCPYCPNDGIAKDAKEIIL